MLIYLLAILVQATACDKESQSNSSAQDINYRDEMRSLVGKISGYGKSRRPGFLVVPQNGISLVTQGGEPGDPPAFAYLESVDACGQESLFYGYKRDNKSTPKKASQYTNEYLQIAQAAGKAILVTDYAQTEDRIRDAYEKNQALGYLSFGAVSRELDVIPEYPDPPFDMNSTEVHSIADAKNFLYLLNYDRFDSKELLLQALEDAAHDVFILDLYYQNEPFTEEDLSRIRQKPQGGTRKILSYFSIGEAEDYRHYWEPDWEQSSPSWLEDENPNWPGNYKVRYWDPEWQEILFGSEQSYLDKILKAGFDGVYLDIIDGFEYFESR